LWLRHRCRTGSGRSPAGQYYSSSFPLSISVILIRRIDWSSSTDRMSVCVHAFFFFPLQASRCQRLPSRCRFRASHHTTSRSPTRSSAAHGLSLSRLFRSFVPAKQSMSNEDPIEELLHGSKGMPSSDHKLINRTGVWTHDRDSQPEPPASCWPSKNHFTGK
jgi:hypothetical protein